MKFEMPMFGEGALYSSNLTPHPTTGIGGWTDAEVIASMKEMKRKDGSPIMGPMQMYLMGWSKISDADMSAIVAFLRCVAGDRQRGADLDVQAECGTAAGCAGAAG